VIATLTQIGQVTGVATVGTLFLNLDSGTLASSAHAVAVVCLVAAALALAGAAVAARIPGMPKA
jgi:hypothetical protein